MTDQFFTPDAAGTRRHLTRLHARFRETLAHLFERCAGHVPFDGAGADALLARLGEGVPLLPEVYARYFDVLAAIEAEDLGRLETALAGLLAPACRALPVPLTIRPLCSTTFTAEEARLAREPFAGEGLREDQIGMLEGEAADTAVRELQAAIALLARAAPQSHAATACLTSEILAVRGKVLDGMEFDGASTLRRFGSVLLNMARKRSMVELAETLVHESAHGMLFAMGPEDTLVLNDPGERHASPLRLDPRPLEGIFHATFVLARMHFAMREILTSPAAESSEKAEAERLAADSHRHFFAGLGVLRQHALLTETGAAILDETEAYMRGVPDPARQA